MWVDIIYKVVGVIFELDVILVEVFNVIIIGFNVCLILLVKFEVEINNIDICLYWVIYNVIEEVEDVMKGMLELVYEEEVLG